MIEEIKQEYRCIKCLRDLHPLRKYDYMELPNHPNYGHCMNCYILELGSRLYDIEQMLRSYKK